MYTGQRRTGILTGKDGYLYKYYKGLFTFLFESFSKKAEACFSVKSAAPSTIMSALAFSKLVEGVRPRRISESKTYEGKNVRKRQKV